MINFVELLTNATHKGLSTPGPMQYNPRLVSVAQKLVQAVHLMITCTKTLKHIRLILPIAT